MLTSANKQLTAVFYIALVLLSGCRVQPDPQTLDFGSVLVGTTASAKTAHWVNHSEEDTAELHGLQIQGPYQITNAAAFGQQTLAPGASSQTISVTFSPTDVGSFPEEVRAFSTGVDADSLQLRGRGVWQLFSGAFVLANKPATTVGSFTFGSSPIQDNKPIDWGTRRLNGPAVESEFLLRNHSSVDILNSVSVSLVKGDQHFEIFFPADHTSMSIAPNGTREIKLRFTPRALGEWQDILLIMDSRNPANHAAIVLKARVATEIDLDEDEGH